MRKGSGAGLHRRDVGRTCIRCGAAFLTNLIDIGKGWGKYCSNHCRNEARADISLADRLWPKVVKGDGCWEFTGRKLNGYGALNMRAGRSLGKPYNLFAHRVSWELTNGPIPGGLLVYHRCDNPPCVRPDHLFLGTAADNIRDASNKGRCFKQDWTHCKYGHEFTPENTIQPQRGNGRRCRVCHLELQRQAQRRHRAKKAKFKFTDAGREVVRQWEG